jgi:hypothetical protein
MDEMELGTFWLLGYYANHKNTGDKISPNTALAFKLRLWAIREDNVTHKLIHPYALSCLYGENLEVKKYLRIILYCWN